MNTVDVLPLPAALVDALRGVCTATLTTVLLKKGLRNVWMRGTKPLQAGGERLVGRAFTLRFVPAREDLATPAYVVERTKSREHGDYATNMALLLAKPAGMKPLELADLLVATLPASQHVQKVSVAGPGFINFTLARNCRLGTIRRVFELGKDYGRVPAGSRESVTVEFVSANPNGPLHVGHGRGAAYGASVASLGLVRTTQGLQATETATLAALATDAAAAISELLPPWAMLPR